MAFIIAKHAGFCTGVRNAVETALQVAEECQSSGTRCCSLGDLIHNPNVVKRLKDKGLHPVHLPTEAKNSVLIIRSHGVAPEVLKEAKQHARKVVNCTCPFVTRLHRMVADYSKSGAPVILIGDKRHPEIIGTAGWCQGEVFILDSAEEIDVLPERAAHALVVCQTTFQPDQWEVLRDRLIARFPTLTVRRTICHATLRHQSEAIQIAKQVDLMIVVGGRNSANTRKLYHTCKGVCPNTYLVERAADLPSHIMHPKWENIGITAGASTPDWSLKEVVDSMNDIERNDQVVQPEVPQDAQEAQPMEAAQEAVEATAPVEEAVAQNTEQNTPEPEQEQPQEAPVEAEEAMTAPTPEEGEAEAPVQEEAPAQEETPAQEEAPAPEPEKSFMDQVADSIARIRPGQTIEGKVVQMSDDEVCVNIGYKSDGLIKRSEMVDKDVNLGDTIEVEIVKVNDGEGNVILSQRNIINRKVWEEIKRKYEAGEFVDAVGKEAVKGGLLASIDGVRAFVPASHLSQRYVDKISQFVGQDLKLKIIEIDDAKKRVVASRKAVLAEESARLKEEAWQRLVEGDIVKGIVRRFAPFGAFVDLGGVDGLIHISDLSWNRSDTPADVLKINEEIDVKILSLDRERERIQLGYKQLLPKPWDNVEEKYPVGTVITRKVVRIRPFGAFIELEPGVDGLCHISQVAMTRVNKVEDVLTPGQDVNVKILSVDPDARRISLSIREAMEDNAFDYSQDIPGMDYGENELVYDGEAVMRAQEAEAARAAEEAAKVEQEAEEPAAEEAPAESAAPEEQQEEPQSPEQVEEDPANVDLTAE